MNQRISLFPLIHPSSSVVPTRGHKWGFVISPSSAAENTSRVDPFPTRRTSLWCPWGRLQIFGGSHCWHVHPSDSLYGGTIERETKYLYSKRSNSLLMWLCSDQELRINNSDEDLIYLILSLIRHKTSEMRKNINSFISSSAALTLLPRPLSLLCQCVSRFSAVDVNLVQHRAGRPGGRGPSQDSLCSTTERAPAAWIQPPRLLRHSTHTNWAGGPWIPSFSSVNNPPPFLFGMIVGGWCRFIIIYWSWEERSKCRI